MIFKLEVIHATIRGCEPLAVAVQMLWRARQYAQRAKCNPWQFALELDEFHRAGVCKSELRWLLMGGLVEHAQEVFDFAKPGRKFKKLPRHIVPANASFVLSDLGLARLAQFSNGCGGASPGINGSPKLAEDHQQLPDRKASGERLVPRWDQERRELRFNGTVVKQYFYASPNQEILLAAFQEEGWPRRIDDPLHPIAERDSRERLRNAIKGLNRGQARPLILFSGDGTGCGVLWQLRSPGAKVTQPR